MANLEGLQGVLFDMPHPDGPVPWTLGYSRGTGPFTDFEVTLARQIMTYRMPVSWPPHPNELPTSSASWAAWPWPLWVDLEPGTMPAKDAEAAENASALWMQSDLWSDEPQLEEDYVQNPSLFSHKYTTEGLIQNFQHNVIGRFSGNNVKEEKRLYGPPCYVVSDIPNYGTVHHALGIWEAEQEERELETRWRATKRVSENWLSKVERVRARRRPVTMPKPPPSTMSRIVAKDAPNNTLSLPGIAPWPKQHTLGQNVLLPSSERHTPQTATALSASSSGQPPAAALASIPSVSSNSPPLNVEDWVRLPDTIEDKEQPEPPKVAMPPRPPNATVHPFDFQPPSSTEPFSWPTTKPPQTQSSQANSGPTIDNSFRSPIFGGPLKPPFSMQVPSGSRLSNAQTGVSSPQIPQVSQSQFQGGTRLLPQHHVPIVNNTRLIQQLPASQVPQSSIPVSIPLPKGNILSQPNTRQTGAGPSRGPYAAPSSQTTLSAQLPKNAPQGSNPIPVPVSAQEHQQGQKSLLSTTPVHAPIHPAIHHINILKEGPRITLQQVLTRQVQDAEYLAPLLSALFPDAVVPKKSVGQNENEARTKNVTARPPVSTPGPAFVWPSLNATIPEKLKGIQVQSEGACAESLDNLQVRAELPAAQSSLPSTTSNNRIEPKPVPEQINTVIQKPEDPEKDSLNTPVTSPTVTTSLQTESGESKVNRRPMGRRPILTVRNGALSMRRCFWFEPDLKAGKTLRDVVNFMELCAGACRPKQQVRYYHGKYVPRGPDDILPFPDD